MLNVNKMTATSDLLALNLEDCKMIETPSDQNIFMDLNEKDAETISGGAITIYNDTDIRIPYTVDGKLTTRPYGGSEWNVGEVGTIDFDYDFGLEGVQSRKYDLTDGRKYTFRYDTRTPYANDIDLFDTTT